MSSPVFSHMFGTITLLGVMIVIAVIFVGIQTIIESSLQKLRLSEIAESVAREIVELSSVHTLGEGKLTYMWLTLPSEARGQGYEIYLKDLGNGRFLVRVQLQIYQQVRVVVVPNFGEHAVQVVAGEVKFSDNFYVSNKLLLPIPEHFVNGRKVAGRPVIVAFDQGDKVYLGIGVIWGEG